MHNSPFRQLTGWMTGFARRAASNRDGAIAIQFALLALPLCLLAFGLLDVNRATTAKQELQDSLDAATLLAARSTATTDAGLQAIGAPALTADMARHPNQTLTSSAFHVSGDFINATASVQLTPIVANLWQSGPINVQVTSQVARTMNKVEVALVLDNTGSMAQNLGSGGRKIDALTTAASSLVDTLYAAGARSADPTAVKFSVVPFSQTVNVGAVYQNAAWISPGQPAAYPGADNFSTAGANRFTLLSQLGLSWAGCVESRPAPYDVQDTPPTTGASLFVPYFAPDEPDNNTIPGGRGFATYSNNNWITNDQTASNVASVRQNNLAKYAATNSGAVVRAAMTGTTMGPNRDCSITPLLRLNTSAVTTKAKLASMTANGNTNVAMGLVWGWHTLSPNAPFADGVAYGTPRVQKIVIVLTDGDNTNDDGASSGGANNANNSIYTGLGYIGQQRLLDAGNNPVGVGSTSVQRRDAIDSREAKVCANMKAQNIVIYAIGVGVSNHSRTLLQGCASGADHYYDVTDSAQLASVFNAIAGSIENLRISR